MKPSFFSIFLSTASRYGAAVSCRLPRAAGAVAVLALGGVAFVPAAPALVDMASRPETVITSDELDMVGGEDANHFYFRGNVRVQATNMLATCDQMEVISARQPVRAPAQGGADAGAPAASSASGSASSVASPVPQGDAAAANIGSIREIIMTGNVVISQEGRRATAGKAILYPQEGRVVLADGPKVTDEQGTLSGWRMELNRGEKTVRILSNPEDGSRTRVTLPSMQDLGYRELGGSGTAPAPAAAASSSSAASAEGTPAASASAASPAASTGASATPAPAEAPASADVAPAAKEEASSRDNGGRGWNPVTSPRRR